MAGIKGRRHTKGTASLTHPGLMNYSTKKGSTTFDENGRRIIRKRKPYTKKK